MIESELFGHEKGAFTGATSRKAGKFERSHQGSLFLDEIGDMPMEIQVKLLRAIEDRRIQHLGSVDTIQVDVRFIAATNQDLGQLVKKEVFRQDLYYRLNVVAIHMPPLRQRREDIPLLAEHFLKTTSPPRQLSSAALQLLMAYDWPGNVRELKNSIESAAVMAKERIDPVHLPSSVTSGWPGQRSAHAAEIIELQPTERGQRTIDQHLQEIEKRLLVQALSQSRGVQKQAASILGIKERSLWHRLKKYEIDAAAFKNPK